MVGIELLNDHPKAAVVIKQWFLEKMLEGLKDENLPEDFKNYVRQQDITNDKIGALIDANPRALFDVFDSHKIFIGTIVDELNGFWWTIGSDKSKVGYEFRVNCEKSAIELATSILNEKL
mgnify:CR=1 FL=1